MAVLDVVDAAVGRIGIAHDTRRGDATLDIARHLQMADAGIIDVGKRCHCAR